MLDYSGLFDLVDAFANWNVCLFTIQNYKLKTSSRVLKCTPRQFFEPKTSPRITPVKLSLLMTLRAQKHSVCLRFKRQHLTCSYSTMTLYWTGVCAERCKYQVWVFRQRGELTLALKILKQTW